SRNTNPTSDSIHTSPVSAITWRIQTRGSREIVHDTGPTNGVTSRIALMPTTIGTWLSITAFGGARSIGNTVLLSTALFAMTEPTPEPSASLVIRNGTRPAKINSTYCPGVRPGTWTRKITRYTTA